MFCYCSVCDDNFVPHFATLLASVGDHGPAAPFYLIGDRISTKNAERLAGFAESIGIDLRLIDGSQTDRSNLKSNDRFRPAVWLKVFAPELLPAEFDRALLLDCDMVVIRDLSELVDMDLGDSIIATGPDVPKTEIPARKRLGLPEDAVYGNMGVTLFDLNAWRQEKCSEAVRQFALTNHEKLALFDQCAINAVLVGRNKQFDQKWNFLVYHHETKPADVSVLHFCGPKPWKQRWVAGGEFYQHYRDKTPWPDFDLPRYPPPLTHRTKLAADRIRRTLASSLGIKTSQKKLDELRFTYRRSRELSKLFHDAALRR